MWVRKRIDIGWLDLLYAAVNCFRPGSRSSASLATEAAWSTDGCAFVCLSVRTGLDLVLKALELPAGSEVLISAITIPDMVRIIEYHGLVPVPIDLLARDMSPRVELLEKAVTTKTRVILVAHLLGGRFDLAPFDEFARRYDLILLEDCAQAFEGDRYRGSDKANISMFSFGPIKTATALGGGLFRVRDDSLLNRIRGLHSQYRVQSRSFFLKRVLFYSILKGLGRRMVFALFFRACRLFGQDLDHVLNGSIRNFPQAEFFTRLREQPSLPLLRLISRRIIRYRNEDLDRRTARGQLLASLLPVERCPGGQSAPHSFWIFPLLVSDKSAAIAALQRAGFDATSRSSLLPVEPPEDRPELEPEESRRLLGSAIYLPLYSAIPESEIRRMATVLTPVFRRDRQ